MKRLRRTRPDLILILVGALCFVAGLATFTFVRAEGHSYFSDDPDSCMNCHVMRDQYDAWGHSSHARVATCNDCHSSHDGVVSKLISKGINGFNHSFAFTFNTYEETITITEFNEDIVNDSCMYCHSELVSMIAPNHEDQEDELDCISCHAGIGHPVRK